MTRPNIPQPIKREVRVPVSAPQAIKPEFAAPVVSGLPVSFGVM